MVLTIFKKEGKAVEKMSRIKAAKEFKRAKIDLRSGKRKGLNRLIIGIGQIHPVSRGRFAYLEARRIGKVQSWIFDCCHYLSGKWKVKSFGQEGFSFPSGRAVRARMDPKIIKELQSILKKHGDTEAVLLNVTSAWRKSLKRKNKEEVKLAVTKLNGLALLQAVDPHVTIFPIEQKAVHGIIGDNLNRLQKEIGALESTSEFKSYRRKSGKKLTKDEYAVAVQHNALVKEFNKMIKHPDRERSILREVLEHADKSVTVFVLGQGHRHAFLSLARHHVPDDVLFAWITPPHLWWWSTMLKRASWIVLVVVITLGIYIWPI